ncbi:MAG: hypothetical protein ABW047_14465 [Nitrospiraceae bacterium]|jgi:hypothetical protein
MHSKSDALSGLRKELLEFMRSCEALLSVTYSEALSEDEAEILRQYVQWLSEAHDTTKKSPEVFAQAGSAHLAEEDESGF